MHPEGKTHDRTLRPAPASRVGGPLFALGFFVVFVAGAELGHWLAAEPGHFATFWPNSGLYLAVLLRTAPRRWWLMVPAGAAANLASDVLFHGRQVEAALGFTLANTVEALAGAVVLRAWLGPAVRVDRLRNVLGLVTATAAVSAPLGGLIGAATVSAVFGASFSQTWQVWWVADALGVLLVVPLVFSLLDLNARPRPARLLEGAGIVAGLIAAGTYVFTSTPPTAPIVLLMLLLWAAVRLGISGVGVTTFVLAVVAVRHTVAGHGLFAEIEAPLMRVAAVQVFVAVAAVLFYCFAVVLDERRRAEAMLEQRVIERTAELAEQTERLRTTFECMTDGFLRFDRDWRVVYENAEAERIDGRPRSEVLGKTLWESWPATIGSRFEFECRRAVAERVTVEFENYYEPWNSWFSVKGFPTPDGGLAIYFIEITARKQADESRRRSEERLRLAAEAVNGIIYEYDIGAGRVDRTRGLYEVLGHRPEDVPPTIAWWAEQVHPDDRDRFVRTDPDTTPTGRILTEYRIRHHDGRWLNVEDRAVLICDDVGRPARMIGCVVDVTDRRRAEEEARRRAEEVQVLFDTLPVGIFVAHDSEGRTITGNPAAQELLRTPTGNLSLSAPSAEQPQQFRVCRNGVDLPADQLPVQRAARGEVVMNEEVELVFADGRVVYELISAAPLYDAQGEVRGAVAGVLDTSALKRAEKERERLEATLNSLVASAPVGIVLFDADMRYRHVNGPLAEMNGIPAEDHIGKTVGEIVPDLYAQAESLFRKVLEEGKAIPDFVLEGETPKNPGVKRWWRESWFPVAGPDGKPSGVGAIVQEVTEQRRLEHERENSRRTLVNLVEQCPFGIYIVDADFRVATVNAGSQTGAFANVRPLLGRPFDEVLRILWPEPLASELVRIFRHTLDTGEPYRSTDFISPRADVDRVEGYEWELHRITLPDGRQGVVCYYFDATKLRRVERELRESERRYRLVGEAANDALWDWDLATDGVVWNDGVQRLFGYTAEQVAPKASWWVEHVHPEDQDRVIRSIHAVLDGTEELWAGEYRFRRADGSYAAVFDRGKIVREGERPVRMVGSMLDLTERKRLEDELRHIAAELSDAGRKKDEFLATLAHELRNPLAPIRTGLQVMKLAADDAQAVEQSIGMMERQVGQMVRLVDDLMDVSRISRGNIELRRQRVPVASVVHSAVETSRPLIDRMGHRLAVALPNDPLVVDADPMRLAQVFANLLNNSAKYSDRGSRIRLAVERHASDVIVSVKDDGIGIPRDRLAGIFDMFSQVDRSLEKSQGGLGIGLHLVKRLVEMHDGSVHAESDGPGKGSEFIVRLPAVLDDRLPSDPSEEPAVRRSTLRILVVDDNRDGADSLAMMLRLSGNDARTAYDGQQGIELAGSYRPDVALFDIGLPKLNGYEACRRIREQPWGDGIVMVAVTGWGQDEDRRRSHDAGFDHHMVKPVDPTALMKFLTERNAESR